MIPVIPTQSGQKAMDDQGLSLDVLVDLLRDAELIEPVRGYPDRRAFFTGNDTHGDFEIWLAPAVKYGEKVWMMLGLRRWVRPVFTAGHQPVVGVERTRGQRRSHGRAGNTLPTDFPELMRRVEQTPGWHCERTTRHIRVVGPQGQAVTIPASTSDYRAVRNAAAQLRQAGLDLRRTG